MTDSITVNKKIYKGLDVCKLIAAVLVVFLHTVENSDYIANGIKFTITAFAVPFFFIASGFLFFKGLDCAANKKEYFIKYEKNLILLFIVWALIIYSPLVIKSYIQGNPDASGLKIVLLLIRRIFIIGPGVYWYLLALIITICFLYFCYEKKTEKLLIIAMIIGFSLNVMYTSFNSFLSEISIFNYLFNAIYFIFSWESNFIMCGIPFCGLGFIIAKYNFNISLKLSALIFVVFTLARVFEYTSSKIFSDSLFFQNNRLSIAYVLQAVAFFFIALNIQPSVSEKTSKALRQLSSFIYFSHAIILYSILNKILEKYMGNNIYLNIMLVPKLLLTLIICVILFVIIKRINNKVLNILING